MNYIEEEKEKIIDELIKSKKIKAVQSINYEYFLEIYKPYKDRMEEKEFAGLLEISYSNFMCMKHQGTKAKVLKNRKKEISEEEKKKIIDELVKSKKIKAGQSINYEYFLEIYEPYRDRMEEKEFALLLGISYSSYMNMKNQGGKTKVLKNRKEEISKEEKKKIIDELIKSKKIKVGQSINYEYFLEIYEPYKDRMEEKEFAGLLGISYANYLNIKHKGAKAKVYNYYDKEKIDRIRYILNKESRFYLKSEIEYLSKQYDIEIETIIQNIMNISERENTLIHMNLLQEKGKIWIGKQKFSKEFASKYARFIIDEAERSSKILCKKYNCNNVAQDLAGDAIEYLLKKCGFIEKNFSDDDCQSKNLIGASIYLHIKYNCLKKLRLPKENSLYRTFTYKGEEKEGNIGIKDETQNTENEVEEKILKENLKNKSMEEICIEILLDNINRELSSEEVIEIMSKKLKISKEDMLEKLKNYMLEKNRVRQTDDGDYILGE